MIILNLEGTENAMIFEKNIEGAVVADRS